MTSQIETCGRRGPLLATMAILFALEVIVDLIKAFTTPPPGMAIGMVVLGVRHTGASATVSGIIVAMILFCYAIGIWRMKRYALAVAWIYAAYVMLNVTLYALRNPWPRAPGPIVFAIAYMAGGVLFTAATAIVLTRRRAQLS